MMPELLIFLITLTVGIVAGWLLRIPGNKKLLSKIQILQGKLQDCSVMNNNLSAGIIQSENLLNKVEDITGQLKASQDHCEILKNEVSLLAAKLAETEALLHTGQPVVYELKLKLIEANNTILRYKSKLINAGGQP